MDLSNLPADMPEAERRGIQLTARLVTWEQQGARAAIDVGPYTLFSIIGALQLCYHHPEMSGFLKDMLRKVGEQMAEQLVGGYPKGDPEGPELAATIAKGWEPR